MPVISEQFSVFKDCLARRFIAQPTADETSDLDDFTSYLADEVWPFLPAVLREASYDTRDKLPEADTISLDNTPTSFVDTLVSYGLSSDDDAALTLLRKVVVDYIAQISAPLPQWGSTRTETCELCERAVPLTYHHLIPRSTHTKVLKSKWHPERMLNSVAWLCRPCHTVVHACATNEELARNFYSMKLLLERQDLQKWRGYAAKQRFGTRRG